MERLVLKGNFFVEVRVLYLKSEEERLEIRVFKILSWVNFGGKIYKFEKIFRFLFLIYLRLNFLFFR